MPENPWKHKRSRATAGGIRKLQNRHFRDQEFAWNREQERILERNKAEAVHTIEVYNRQLARHETGSPVWTPLLMAANLTGRTWMHVHCPGCNTVAAVDLTVIRRPEMTALTSIAEKLKCKRCRGQAAPPRIVKLSASHEG